MNDAGAHACRLASTAVWSSEVTPFIPKSIFAGRSGREIFLADRLFELNSLYHDFFAGATTLRQYASAAITRTPDRGKRSDTRTSPDVT
jgi:hypothetical protein